MKQTILKIVVVILAFTVMVCAGRFVSRNFEVQTPTARASFTIPTEENSTGSPFKYYYKTLTQEEQKAYFAVLSQAEAMPESIAIPPLEDEGLDHMLGALLMDNPELWFLGAECRTTTVGDVSDCRFTYTMNANDCAEIRAQLEERTQEILASLTDPDDPWQTELELHNAIVESCEYLYDESPEVSTVPGALLDGKASCAGYANAFKYLLDRCGIENYLISGDGTNRDGTVESHMWNIVKINGCYCHVDVTWDDPVGGKGGEYEYFNITDEEISADHKNWSFPYPCESETESWFAVNGMVFSGFGAEEEEFLAQTFARELDGGARAVSIRFTDRESYRSGVKKLLEGERIYSVLRAAAKQSKAEFYTSKVSYAQTESKNMITFYPRMKG